MIAPAPFASPELFARFFSGKGPWHTDRNKWLLHQGTPVGNIYVVESGLAMEFSVIASVLQPMCFCPPGTLTGIRWSTSARPHYEHSTVALQPLVVRPMEAQDFVNAQRDDGDFRAALMAELLRRLECSRTIADSSSIQSPLSLNTRRAPLRGLLHGTPDIRRELPSIVPLITRLVAKGLIPTIAAEL